MLLLAALCGIQGYNAVTIQQHFSNMRRNYSWGTVNELVLFGILAGINVSYINAANHRRRCFMNHTKNWGGQKKKFQKLILVIIMH